MTDNDYFTGWVITIAIDWKICKIVILSIKLEFEGDPHVNSLLTVIKFEKGDRFEKHW